MPRAELGTEKLRGARGDDPRAFGDPARDDGTVAGAPRDLDTAARVRVAAEIFVDPGVADHVVVFSGAGSRTVHQQVLEDLVMVLSLEPGS